MISLPDARRVCAIAGLIACCLFGDCRAQIVLSHEIAEKKTQEPPPQDPTRPSHADNRPLMLPGQVSYRLVEADFYLDAYSSQWAISRPNIGEFYRTAKRFIGLYEAAMATFETRERLWAAGDFEAGSFYASYDGELPETFYQDAELAGWLAEPFAEMAVGNFISLLDQAAAIYMLDPEGLVLAQAYLTHVRPLLLQYSKDTLVSIAMVGTDNMIRGHAYLQELDASVRGALDSMILETYQRAHLDMLAPRH